MSTNTSRPMSAGRLKEKEDTQPDSAHRRRSARLSDSDSSQQNKADVNNVAAPPAVKRFITVRKILPRKTQVSGTPSSSVRQSPRTSGSAVRQSPRTSGSAVRQSPRTSGSAVRQSPRTSGSAVRESSQTSGSTVRQSPRTSGSAVRESSQTSGSTVRQSPRTSGSAVRESSQTSGSTVRQSPRTSGSAVRQSSQTSGSSVRQSPRTSSSSARRSPRTPGSSVRRTPRVTSECNKENVGRPSGQKQNLGQQKMSTPTPVPAPLPKPAILSPILAPAHTPPQPTEDPASTEWSRKVRRSYSRLSPGDHSFESPAHAPSSPAPHRRETFFGFERLQTPPVVGKRAERTGVLADASVTVCAGSLSLLEGSGSVADTSEPDVNIPGVALVKEKRKRKRVPQMKLCEFDTLAAKLNAEFEEAENFDLVVE